MTMHEAARATGLTKKAIEYYAEKGLISPAVRENGYRDFDGDALERLREIAALRGCGLSIAEIGQVLADASGEALRRIATGRTLEQRRFRAQKELLDALAAGRSYGEIEGALEALEAGRSITERLLGAFPGYYGRFVALHFARFLQGPIENAGQRQALGEILAFLDDLPGLELDGEVRAYLEEATREIRADDIESMMASYGESIDNIGDFLEENRAMLEEYMAYKQSEEYRQSPAARLETALKTFSQASGYNDVFLPAMRRLSPSYAAYCDRLEAANEVFLKQYPELK